MRQLLNYLCSEDIACKEEKKDRRFSRNKIHRNIGNLLREFSAIKWDATVTAVIKGNQNLKKVQTKTFLRYHQDYIALVQSVLQKETIIKCPPFC